MDHVDGAAGLAREPDEERDRGVLPGRRPRMQIAGVPARIALSVVGGGAQIQLGMRQERQPGVAEHGHRRPQVRLGGVRELVDARVNEEGFAAERAARSELGQLAHVPRDHAPPETDVDVELSLGGAQLLLEGGAPGGDRKAVERHVDQRGHATSGGGAGRRREPLPVGAAGLVDVDVAVDQPGRNHARAEILDRDVRRHGGRRRPGDERADAPLLDEHGAWPDAAVRPDDPPAAEPPEARMSGQLRELRAGADSAGHQNSVSAKVRRLSKCASRSSTKNEPVMAPTRRGMEYFIPEMLAPPKPRLKRPPKV